MSGMVSANAVKKDKRAKKTLKNSNKLGGVEAKWYKARKCYRVWVPARLSEKGKDCRRFFETKEEAEKFIFETKRSGSVELAELAVEEKHILGVIRQSQKYEPRLLLEAWQCFEKEEIGEARNLTVLELVEKFVSRQKAQGRSTRTLIDDRSRLKAMTNVMGHIRGGRQTSRHPTIHGRDSPRELTAKTVPLRIF
jgi:hypothetical protein